MRAYAVFHLVGWALAALAASMLLPAVFAVALDSLAIVQAFVVPAFVVGFLGGSLIFAFRDKSVFASRWDSLLLLGLVWLMVPVAAALPFYTAGFPGTLVPAYFEATSGFTTTGATAILELSQTPRAIIIWRALLQWGGGLTTLVALAAILGPLSGSYLLERQLRMVGRSTHGSVRHMVEAIRSITPVYSAMTMACFMALVFAGIPAFDAFCLSLSTVSTGGFMPREGTIELYGSPAAELALSFFMMTSAVSIIWIRAILQRRWMLVRETREPFWIFAIIAMLVPVLCYSLFTEGTESGLRGVFHTLTTGLATAASIVSTTGFSVSLVAQEHIPYIVLLVLGLIGAGRFSTAGGLKVYRALAMLRQCGRELRLLVYPHGVRPARHGEEATDIALVKAIWISFAALIVMAAVLAILLAASGLKFSGALLASAGALSNIGPIYEIARPVHFPDAPSYADMTPWAHLALCFGMIAGRVEILALLTFLNLANWRE